jgi:hypothetical protein
MFKPCAISLRFFTRNQVEHVQTLSDFVTLTCA